MLNPEELDKNFEVKTSIDKDDICFFNIEQKPFKIHGVFKENGSYLRMPEKIAKTVSENVYNLNKYTVGGRVRFVTDSSYIAIKTCQSIINRASRTTLISTMGFDLYVGNDFVKPFIPHMDAKDGFESVIDFPTNEKREITIHFPRASSVEDMYVGIQKDAVLEEATPYKNTKPIVFYGSSITHGGCASRTGMIYQNIISRRFNYDYINLGFSGNARGEQEMSDYIKNLDMSLFVLDYDHNAPTPEHLRETHERFYKTVREKNPYLPIILMSRPKFELNVEETERLEIIKTTFKNAVGAGDKNIYLLDNKDLTAICKNDGTIDGCHPTDFGFVSMAKALGDVIEKINIV